MYKYTKCINPTAILSYGQKHNQAVFQDSVNETKKNNRSITPINRPFKRSDHIINTINQLINQSIQQTNNLSNHQPINQTSQLLNHSRATRRSTRHSRMQPGYSIQQTINLAISQSRHQSSTHSAQLSHWPLAIGRRQLSLSLHILHNRVINIFAFLLLTFLHCIFFYILSKCLQYNIISRTRQECVRLVDVFVAIKTQQLHMSFIMYGTHARDIKMANDKQKSKKIINLFGRV